MRETCRINTGGSLTVHLTHIVVTLENFLEVTVWGKELHRIAFNKVLCCTYLQKDLSVLLDCEHTEGINPVSSLVFPHYEGQRPS